MAAAPRRTTTATTWPPTDIHPNLSAIKEHFVYVRPCTPIAVAARASIYRCGVK